MTLGLSSGVGASGWHPGGWTKRLVSLDLGVKTNSKAYLQGMQSFDQCILFSHDVPKGKFRSQGDDPDVGVP